MRMIHPGMTLVRPERGVWGDVPERTPGAHGGGVNAKAQLPFLCWQVECI